MSKYKKHMMMILIAGVCLLFIDLAVSWHMSDEIDIRLDEDTGQVYLIRPGTDDPDGHLSLRARVTTDHDTYEKNMDLTLSPYLEEGLLESEEVLTGDASTEEERIMYELRAIASDVDSDRSKKRILLPSTLSEGEQVTWTHRRTSHTMLILIVMMCSVALVYRMRFRPLEARRKMEMDSILDSLPDFTYKLVLLMNAGLVLTVAFERAVVTYARGENTESYFYEKMRSIHDSMVNTNGSLTAELNEFARKSGVGDLMRVSTIISDNVNKGTELIEKLERESESLWFGRKLKMEERGRLAETKMTLPLSVFLGVLILITVSPALLEL